MRALAGMVLLGAAASAHAFAEDNCYFYSPSGMEAGSKQVFYYPFNCYDLQCMDGPDGSNCYASGLRQYLGTVFLGTHHAHNSFHYDLAYLYARLVGLDRAQATELAALGESVDIGTYRTLTLDPPDGGPRTATLSAPSTNIYGLVRTNAKTEGFWLHYVPWYRPAPWMPTTSSVNTSTYDGAYASKGKTSPFPDSERGLNHVRRWAFTPGAQLCKFGMADAQGACLWQPDQTPSTAQTLYSSFPLVADAVAFEGSRPLTWQEVHENDDDPNGDAYSEGYGPSVAGSYRALGMYLHMLGDRISHGYCVDNAYVEPNDPARNPRYDTQGNLITDDYVLVYPSICGTLPHGQLHYEESAHGADTPERSKQAIELQLREVLDWGKKKGLTPKQAVAPGFYHPSDPRFVQDMVSRVTFAISRPCTNHRLAELCKIARVGYGVDWYDGNPDCSYPTFPDDNQCR